MCIRYRIGNGADNNQNGFVNKFMVGVHDGKFHADDVTAVALLLMYGLVHIDLIIRTRNLPLLQQCEYVCDVGGVLDFASKRFDHHQKSYTGNRASAGLVLQYLQDEGYIIEDEAVFLADNYINSVDLIDTGQSLPTTAHIVDIVDECSSLYPYPVEEELNSEFTQAVLIITSHLDRLMIHYHSIKNVLEPYIKSIMDKSVDLLIFDKYIEWVTTFFRLDGETHPANFVIMPDYASNWILRCVPTNAHGLEMRKLLPKTWHGLSGSELSSLVGIDHGVFCHKNGFISIWGCKKSAEQAYYVMCNNYFDEEKYV